MCIRDSKLNKTLDEIAKFFGPNRQISVSREITKLYEETRRGPVKLLLEYYKNKPAKGEIVLIISGA